MSAVSRIRRRSRPKLSRLLRETRGTISVEQASRSLGLPAKEAAQQLAAWARQGWLSRVRRGLYVPVPLEAPSSDVALEDPWIVADRLFAPCYIGGWSAAEYWDFTEQIFRSVLVLTTKKPRDRKPVIRGAAFVLRTIPVKALFGTKGVWRGQIKVEVSDPSRTIIDLVNDPALGGGVRPCADILQNYLNSKSRDIETVITYAERLNNGAVFKRLGFLLERYAPNERTALEKCRKQLTAGNAKLDPSLPADRLVTRWRLWIPESWAKGSRND